MKSQHKEFKTFLKDEIKLDRNDIDKIMSALNSTGDNSDIGLSSDELEDIWQMANMHWAAEEVIEKETKSFKSELQKLAGILAKREGEEHIITASHVKRARNFMWSGKKKYDFSDAFLGFGGLFAGLGFSHVMDLLKITGDGNMDDPNGLLIISAIIGASLMAMGALAKAFR